MNPIYYLYSILFYPIIYILPAYVANGAPVIFGGKGKPLDMGKSIKGKRIFGDNKTRIGTLSSILSGIIIGLIEYPFLHYMLLIAIVLTIGANFGDLLGSFIKRRIEMKPGAMLPILDQYGFFIFAILLAYPLGHFVSIYGLIFIVALTGILHPLTNIGAHRLKIKKVPW